MAKAYFHPNETMLKLADDLLRTVPALADLARSVPTPTRTAPWGPIMIPLSPYPPRKSLLIHDRLCDRPWQGARQWSLRRLRNPRLLPRYMHAPFGNDPDFFDLDPANKKIIPA